VWRYSAAFGFFVFHARGQKEKQKWWSSDALHKKATSSSRLFLEWLSVTVALIATSLFASAQSPVSYVREIKPFLARYCLECHNTQAMKGDLDLETIAGIEQGGKNGAVLIAGKPDQSRLVLAAEAKIKPTMPPKNAKQPPAGEIHILRDWVASGAKDDTTLVKKTLPSIAPRNNRPAPVRALAYSPDGKLLFAALHKDVLRIEGQNVQTILSRDAPVTALAVVSDGKLLAVASSATGTAGEIGLYSLGSASATKQIRNLSGHTDQILDVAFSPDGKILASTGYDRLIKLWDVDTGHLLRTLKDHSDAVYSLAFDPTGKLLASGSADRAVKVWNVGSGVRLYTLSDPTDWVYAVAWRPDGKQLAAAGVDRSIRTWGVSTNSGKLVLSVFAHEAPISRLRYGSDSSTLYSLGDDRILKAWDAAQLVERRVYPGQPELPLTFSLRPDGKQIAIGRFDGALVILDAANGKTIEQPLPIKPKPPVLTKITPDASPRGQTVKLTLSGDAFTAATEIVAQDAGLTIRKQPGGSATEITASVTIPSNARVGAYKLRTKTAAGTSAPVEFFVDRFKAVPYEVSSHSGAARSLQLPVTVTGTLAQAGEVARNVLSLTGGQQVGVQLVSTNSKLEPVLRVLDSKGKVLAESSNGLLGFTAMHASQTPQPYVLELHDRDFRGSKEMSYRLQIGNIPVVTSVFPLGIQRGTETSVQLQGVFLGALHSAKVSVPADRPTGSTAPLVLSTTKEAPLGIPALLVGDYPEVRASNSGPVVVPVPGVANGVIDKADATQLWKFKARKGQRLILEVNARRLGSPLDSYLEVLDVKSKPLPRAVLRSVGMTYLTFRDHDSEKEGLRLESWNNLAMDDYLLAGGELLRIQALPRGPDDDCKFYSVAGKRVGFLDTTPQFHSMGTPMYQVQIHPPGKTFPANGFPTVQLTYRNDDGGPGYGKDSRLIFDVSADGDYLVRIGDSSGMGGPTSAYRLTIRPAEPRFTVEFAPAKPNVWKGGGSPVAVTATRLDGYEGPIRVHFKDLPPGLHAPETFISPGQFSTAINLSADAEAAEPSKDAMLKLVAEANINGRHVQSEKIGGAPKLIVLGDLTTTTEEAQVVIKPGEEVWMTANIERRNGFKGRVPLDVRGLPHGVRVLDVGLNGIMITENDTSRRFALYAEPWVEAMSLPIVVVAKNEKKGTEITAKPVVLQVQKKE
jgi:WD40 repeat protein